MEREVVSRSPEETRALGRETARALAPGAVLLLFGGLGSGKTTFAKGVGDACGVAAMVKSPTFALMQRYRGTPDLIHIDLYRQPEEASLDDLALDESAGDVITLVEWPKGAALVRWPRALRIRFEHADEGTRRILLP